MSEKTKLSVFRDIMLEMFDDKSMAIFGIVAIVIMAKLGAPTSICSAGIGAMAVLLGKPKNNK
jgi:hypothetical protein